MITKESLKAITKDKEGFLLHILSNVIPERITVHIGGVHNDFVRFEFSNPYFSSFGEDIKEDYAMVDKIIHHLGGRIVSEKGKIPIIALF